MSSIDPAFDSALYPAPTLTDLSPVRLPDFDAFLNFAQRPEHQARRLEYYDGEVLELVSQGKSSELAAWLVFFLRVYLQQAGRRDRITTTDGGYRIGEHAYIPDVALIALDKQPRASEEAYNATPPDLAVEVVSPSDRMDKLMVKVMNFVAVGTLVWVVYPRLQEIHVYAPGQTVRQLGLDDTLTGDELLPGFELPVRELFDAIRPADE